MKVYHQVLAIFVMLALFMFNAMAEEQKPKEEPNNDVKIYIIHGYDASPTRHWFSWLKSELSSEIGGVIKAQNIFIPQMPDAKNTSLESWSAALKEIVPSADSNTYFITHSLGGIVLLNYLSDNNFKIGGVVLVSGFDKPLSKLPQLDSFTSKKLDYKKLISSIKHRVVISARDDKIVPYALSKELSDNIDAKFILERSGGHFMDNEGYTTLRVGYDTLKEMIDEDKPKVKEEKVEGDKK